MFLHTTRSARFFLLLLHLVGVTTHFNKSSSSSSSSTNDYGIRGAHPATTIQLERTDPSWINRRPSLKQKRRRRLDGINNNDRSGDEEEDYDDVHDSENDTTPDLDDPDDDDDDDDDDIYNRPHWVQDIRHDQKCLGPMSTFGECGDASLWKIVPARNRQSNTKNNKKRNYWSSSSSSPAQSKSQQWIRWATEEGDYYNDIDVDEDDTPQQFALQLVVADEHYPRPQRRQNVTATATGEEETSSLVVVETECLSRRRKDDQLVIVSCDQDRAWYWQINDVGILHFEKPTKKKRGSSSNSRKDKADKRRVLLKKKSGQTLTCLGRNSTNAILLPCDGTAYESLDKTNREEQDEDEDRVSPVRLVRQATQRELNRRKVKPKPNKQATKTSTDKSNKSSQNSQKKKEEPSAQDQSSGGIPSHKDRVHTASTGRIEHTEVLASTRLSSLLSLSRSSAKVAKKLPRFLGDTNPILLSSPALTMESLSSSKSSTGASSLSSPTEHRNDVSPPPSSAHGEHVSSSSSSSSPIVRKIEFNPYIAASKDETWTDPQTGLVYPTDLCRYLGHDRKESGRHTLTGVGQYTKTMLKIKVYGVAMYVSKRDVLADPIFEPFASMSTKELQQNDQFYQVLRRMTSSPNGGTGLAGNFDRTLFLKINMQLATDTMRSSLDADWKMLTPEDKGLLIGSSMKERPADQRMLEIIESPDNPSKCSCAQIAPPEYNADPSCCARGTELVFTWRKNGDLEVRLNGRLMDSFPRPDIASGIFFEYLRRDDPMSFDFLDRVVEGFPFLMAPLSQVKGVATMMHPTSTPPETTHVGTTNFIFRTFDHVGGVLSSQASVLADLVQTGADEFSSSAVETARSMGSAARNLGEEMERRRESIGKHMVAFTSQAMSSFHRKDQASVMVPFPMWITESELDRISSQLLGHDDESYGVKEDESIMQRLASVLGIEPSVNNVTGEKTYATQKWLFGLVHLYLLLILISSFPEQRTKRTKMVVVSHKDKDADSVADSHSDTDESDSEDCTYPLEQ
mmetsp:Transcript_31615/g.76745  ORF Transcript_31615/g.76745 Transcript_31615/m.76745 type:complete len:1024 (-) Transcript_31615:2697-5768(-)